MLRIIRSHLGLLVLVATTFLASCKGGDITAGGGDATAIAQNGNNASCATGTVASVTVSPHTLSVPVGSTAQLGYSSNCAGAPTWASDNLSIATVSNGVVTGVSTGTTWIRAFIIVNGVKVQDSSFVTVTPTGTTPACDANATVTITPPGNQTIFVGDTVKLNGLVSGNCATKTIVWSTSGKGAVTVDQTGRVIGINPGTDSVFATYTFTTGGTTRAWVIFTVNSKNAPPSVSIQVLVSAMSYSTCNAFAVPLYYSVSTTGNATTGVTITSTGNVVNVVGGQLVLRNPPVAGTDVITITSQYNPSVKATATFTVTLCPPTTHVFTVNPNPITGTFCATGFTGTSIAFPFVFTSDGATISYQNLNWSLPTGSSIQIDAGTGKITPIAVGTSTVRFSLKGDPNTSNYIDVPVNITNTLCVPVQSTISVSLTPATFSLIIGGQAAVLTATTNDPQGVTFTTNKPNCVLLTTNGNTVSVAAITACTGITVTATSKTDVSKSATSNGSVSNGTVTCIFTSDVGTQSDGTIRLNVGQTAILTGMCTNQNGSQFIPYWFSTDPSRVAVIGSTTVVPIAGINYPAGPQATIKGIGVGQADITMQVSVTDPTPLFKRTVKVQ